MIKIIFKVIIFAISFGFIEAAVVVYLRHLLGIGFTPPHIERSEILFLTPGIAFLDPQTAVKIITDTALLNIERIREASTLVVLATVAAIAGKQLKEKLTFFFLAFGIWDIFYYIGLWAIVRWPYSLLTPDILFLIPVPWVAQIWFPALVSLLAIAVLLIGKRNHTAALEREKF